MTTPLSSALDFLPSSQLCSESLGLCIYPNASDPDHALAFIDGCQISLEELDHLRLTLIRACATIAAGGRSFADWDTALGVVEVTRTALNVRVNGEDIAPATVASYADEIGQLLVAAGHRDD